MLSNDNVQYFSLIISIILVLSMIILVNNKKNAILFYVSMIVGWSSGIIYYIALLFLNTKITEEFGISISHLSAQLRLFQYLIFGSWFFFDALEISVKHIREKLERIKLDKRLDEIGKTWEGEDIYG